MNKRDEAVLEEFRAGRPKDDERLEYNGESETYRFGYKHLAGERRQIHEVTDWGNIETFLLQKLQEEREQAKNEFLEVLEREVKEVLPIQQLINGQLKDTGFIEKGVVSSILNQHKKH